MYEPGVPARLRPVLRLVAQGRRNKAIALELGLAEHTVENYVSELIELYGVESRTELALAVARGGRPSRKDDSGTNAFEEVSPCDSGAQQESVCLQPPPDELRIPFPGDVKGSVP